MIIKWRRKCGITA